MSKDKQNNTNRMVALVMGIIGLTLTIIPAPQAFINFKPNWVLLLLIFLSINLPKQFNLGYAFVFGLIIDVIKGALLGQHALAMTVIVFMTTKYHLQLRIFPKFQLMAIILIILFLYHFILFWINGVAGISTEIQDYWGPVITSSIVWPITYEIMSRYFVYATPKKEV
jgi:rod shape-determining protein MreD